MNILILSETLWPEGSGGELATYLYAKLLVKNNMNVKMVITSGSGNSEGRDGLLTYKLPVVGHGKYVIATSFISRKLRELTEWSDVIYSTDLSTVILFIRQSRKPIVMHIHSYFPVCPVGSLFDLGKNSICKRNSPDCLKCIWYYERAHSRPLKHALASTLMNSTIGRSFLGFMKFADALIFVSKAQRDLFIRHAPVSRPSYVIYNPPPELPYTPMESDDLGYFGGSDPLKGFRILLRAWLQVHAKHDARAHFTKMGKFTGLKEFESLGITAYGKLTENSYENIYRKVRVVVFPSIWQEPLPYVVLEATLRGRFVVVSQVGGVPEIVGGLRGALLFEPNDANALSEALEQVLSMDKGEARELGLRNREDVTKRFDSLKSVRDLIRVFEIVAD